MDAIIKYFRARRGYARMKDIKASGFQTRDIRKLVADGRLEKVTPGLYRLADISPGETTGLVEICLAMPKSIICLTSALAFHELTTFMPTSISFAIPIPDKPVKLSYPPNKPFYFSENQYIVIHARVSSGSTVQKKLSAICSDSGTSSAKTSPSKGSKST
jgi:predicted transcriptional regulator of viral defense system